MTKKKKIILTTAATFVALITCAFLYLFYSYERIHVAGDKKEGITSKGKKNSNYKEMDGITNILIVGVDERKEGEPTRSDAMTILTIDDVHKKIKTTSLMRDLYVEIPGHSEQKLTHAYAYGEIDLLKKTVEENFKIDLSQYVIIDFNGFKAVIDAVGGIEANIKDEAEVKELNRCIDIEIEDNRKLSSKDANYLKHPGVQILNGQQALAFSRMRHVGDGVYDRSRRQREVIGTMINKVKESSLIKYPSVLNSVLPYIKTNIGFTDMLNLAYTVNKINNLNMEQLQIPTNELSDGRILNKVKGWVQLMDKESNTKVLHDFIFEDIKYDPSKYKKFNFSESKYSNSYEPTEKKSGGNTTYEDKNKSEEKNNNDNNGYVPKKKKQQNTVEETTKPKDNNTNDKKPEPDKNIIPSKPDNNQTTKPKDENTTPTDTNKEPSTDTNGNKTGTEETPSKSQ